jgi:hypothetical protein
MIELWFNGKEFLRLTQERLNYFYCERKPFDSTLWISGITRYWLLENNYKKVGTIFEPRNKTKNN